MNLFLDILQSDKALTICFTGKRVDLNNTYIIDDRKIEVYELNGNFAVTYIQLPTSDANESHYCIEISKNTASKILEISEQYEKELEQISREIMVFFDRYLCEVNEDFTAYIDNFYKPSNYQSFE